MSNGTSLIMSSGSPVDGIGADVEQAEPSDAFGYDDTAETAPDKVSPRTRWNVHVAGLEFITGLQRGNNYPSPPELILNLPLKSLMLLQ